MIRLQPLDALLAASTPQTPARFVSVRDGVQHIYVGPMTPDGNLPMNRRPVCKTRTRSLRERRHAASPARVCARCSARLRLPQQGRAEHPQLLTKPQDRLRYQGLTVVDVYLSAHFAVCMDELDECALALDLGFDPQTAAAAYTSPTGRPFKDLPAWIDQRRNDLNPRKPQPWTGWKGHDPGYREAVAELEKQRKRDAYNRSNSHF